MSSEKVIQVTDSNFEDEVAKSPLPVLVDFWAEWCMPCRMLAPTIEELATDYDGRLKVGKLDTDANHQTALKFGIAAIPTLLVFRGGQVVKKFVGMKSKRELKAELDELLK
jgi:thioredoxin 1